MDEKAGENQLLPLDLNRGDQGSGDGLADLRMLARNAVAQADREVRTGRDIDRSSTRLPREGAEKSGPKSGRADLWTPNTGALRSLLLGPFHRIAV